MKDKIIEQISRYLCSLDLPADRVETSWRFFSGGGEGVIRALESAGYRIVGRNPDLETIHQMEKAPTIVEAYRAAFDAAPVYGDQP